LTHAQSIIKDNTSAFNSSSSLLNSTIIVDPHPKLIDNKSGILINDINLVSIDQDKRNGTIADGVSKLLLITRYGNPLNFSIVNNDVNFSKGTLSNLSVNFNSSILSAKNSSIIVKPQPSDNGTSLAVAVYTPPSYPVSTTIPSNKTNGTIKILVQDVKNPSVSSEIPISLYRVPVVLVHGLWSNPKVSWIDTKFNESLNSYGYKTSLADYSLFNAETFDPYPNNSIGNNGTDSIRNSTNSAIKYYHDMGIAASQIDIVGHSMGGLLARGFAQLPDYKNSDNSMQGYIHRLITIGTPHFGGNLASILNASRDIEYCPDPGMVMHSTSCSSDKYKLKDIFALAGYPIDKGGVEALIPNSTAYHNLCQTNVSSYAIAASWSPEANNSYNDIQSLYRGITDNPKFDLDINGFNGTTRGNNDLQVNITSQLGGLPIQFRMLNSTTLPNQSEVYNNTVHYISLLNKTDTNARWELNSNNIQDDVVLLLQSPQDKFANTIGIGSPCQNPR
jgi:pimeloyl-ACP methyl ester carboxylesterase